MSPTPTAWILYIINTAGVPIEGWRAEKILWLADQRAELECGGGLEWEIWDYGPRLGNHDWEDVIASEDVDIYHDGWYRRHYAPKSPTQQIDICQTAEGREAVDQYRDWAVELSFKELISAIRKSYPEWFKEET